MQRLLQNQKLNNNYLLIGLGNPGEDYRGTRHNAGFAVIDYIAEKYTITLKKAFLKPYLIGKLELDDTVFSLVKPLTYMNSSGVIVNELMRRSEVTPDHLYIVCDNMDLKPGLIRLKKKGSSAGHNGIKSIIENIGTGNFNRLYIGVGRPEDGSKVVEHVLGRFSGEDEKAFKDAVKTAADALISLKSESVDQVMNEINKRNH